jgi:hypothetical protein
LQNERLTPLLKKWFNLTDHLPDYPITHAGIKPVKQPVDGPRQKYGFVTNVQTAVRYLRFLRQVQLDRFELPYSAYGRWAPEVPTHPANIIISQLDQEHMQWKTIREIEMPPDARIRGDGLNQEMNMDAMNRHFAQVLKDNPRVFDLKGVISDHLRVECDREHPSWPNHGECNGGPYNVPYGILNSLKAYGELLGDAISGASYSPLLKKGDYHPTAPQGMNVSSRLATVVYSSPWLQVGFSLRRPMLMHLGWDASPHIDSWRGASLNRLGITQLNFLHPAGLIGGLSGPLLRTLNADYGSHLWSGEIHVYENRVSYLNLSCGMQGLSMDATFTIEPQRLILELTQRSQEEFPVLEWEAWRFLFDLKNAMTGTAALPTLSPGRNGDVQFPVLWAGDCGGCLACQLLSGDPEETRFQVESYRDAHCITGGLVLAPRPEAGNGIRQPQCLVIPKGERQARFEISVINLAPVTDKAEDTLPVVLQRHWASSYSCFRPEYGGFSNHAAAVNCHQSQQGPLDIVTRTAEQRFSGGNSKVFKPLDLMRFSVERALLDGGGYGYHRNLYLDSDPVLVAAAGRIFQVDPDLDWLRRIGPGLVDAVDRMESSIGEDGLVICQDLSGNSGSFRWSSNAMDVVGFGHIDGYVNALCYRAFRNAAALFNVAEKPNRAERCRQMAEGIKVEYARMLVNPKTGWVAGWRSRDGRLHDYAFLWINGLAIAFGLLEKPDARRALAGLEALRQRVGPDSAEFGIPHNLLPIDPQDHMLPQILGSLQPTFERYTDGALGAYTLNYYIRALSIYGFKENARKLVDEFAEGLMAGAIIGGMESGVEFHTWEGLPSGYEGTFGPNFAPLYAIGIEYGVFEPLKPEWWLEGG